MWYFLFIRRNQLVISVVHRCDALYVKMMTLSVGRMLAESKRIDLALRQDCEGILLALPGKSRLFWVVLIN